MNVHRNDFEVLNTPCGTDGLSFLQRKKLKEVNFKLSYEEKDRFNANYFSCKSSIRTCTLSLFSHFICVTSFNLNLLITSQLNNQKCFLIRHLPTPSLKNVSRAYRETFTNNSRLQSPF